MQHTYRMRRPKPSPKSLRSLVRRVLADRRGATAIEYGLIVSLVVIAMIASFVEVSNVTRSMWNNVSTKVTNAH